MWTSFNKSRSFSKRSKAPRGFTLIELLVVVIIMVVVSSVLLIQQQKFDSSTVLRSLAYSVALSIRQAQVYGVSVLGTTTSTGVINYAPAYGIYVQSNGSAPITSYTLFADLNDNGQYDPGEAVQVFTLNTGYDISNFGATTTGATPVFRSYTGGTISNLTIVFKRPNPDACIATSNSANACQPGANPSETYSSAYIQIQSTGDPSNTRSVSVLPTGEISVCATTGC